MAKLNYLPYTGEEYHKEMDEWHYSDTSKNNVDKSTTYACVQTDYDQDIYEFTRLVGLVKRNVFNHRDRTVFKVTLGDVTVLYDTIDGGKFHRVFIPMDQLSNVPGNFEFIDFNLV